VCVCGGGSVGGGGGGGERNSDDITWIRFWERRKRFKKLSFTIHNISV